MQFDLNKAIEILERTPHVLTSLLDELSDEWTLANEGGDSWSPFDIIGHLVHGELTDWIPRTRIILNQGDNVTFEPFDRLAQNKTSKGKSLQNLLEEFTQLRKQNLEILKTLNISQKQLDLKGVHPELGEITLRQLLSTWVTHDLGHIAQVTRVMAKQYKSEVGSWQEYIPILTR